MKGDIGLIRKISPFDRAINLTPISKSITGIDYSKTKAIFQATYFESINPIVA